MTVPEHASIFRPRSNSAAEAMERLSAGMGVALVKGSLVYYMRQFLDPTGRHRHLMTATAPIALSYESFTASSDPDVRRIQIGQLWKGLGAALPCILLVDTGFTMDALSLGGVETELGSGTTRTQLRVPFTCPLPVDLYIGERDEASLARLQGLLLLMFGPYKELTKSQVLGPKEGSWVVRLPRDPMSWGGKDRQNVGDDPISTVWFSTASLEIVFEDSLSLAYEKEAVQEPMEDRVITWLSTHETTVTLAATYKIGTVWELPVSYPPVACQIVSNNPRIALIVFDNARQRWYIRPKMPGAFTVQMIEKGSVTWTGRSEIVF